MKSTYVRVILSILVVQALMLHQMDVVTAFLNGNLEEKVYMGHPEWYEKGDRSLVVCRLKRSLYGLKQDPRKWYAKIDDLFDRTLQINWRDSSHLLIIALYVNDLLIDFNYEFTLKDTKKELSIRFKMKDLGESRIILGIYISRDSEHMPGPICTESSF